MFYIECIDATTQQLLLRLLTGCCYALRSTQLANTLPSLMQRPKIFSSISKLQQIFSFLLSLMLRSKIFSSSFQHQPFYAQRSSQLSNIQIRSSLFRHHRCCALRFLLFFSHILRALMLCFSIGFPCFSHCTIIDATL